ncbi:MAG TPA: 4Fe-4S binding protein [Thermoplasmata archaeon]|nr:4Fe-4S binding protein [Thermoplasmata archaeon]HIH29335.1 4Fe-4S binding protein [Thermoplasmata archaeon]
MAKRKAVVKKEKCLACGGCISVCPQDAILMIFSKADVDDKLCNSCSICVKTCPIGAITWEGASHAL